MFFFFFFRLRPLIYFRCLVETCEEFGYFVNMQFYDIEVMFKGSVTHCCYAMYGGATLSSQVFTGIIFLQKLSTFTLVILTNC